MIWLSFAFGIIALAVYQVLRTASINDPDRIWRHCIKCGYWFNAEERTAIYPLGANATGAGVCKECANETDFRA